MVHIIERENKEEVTFWNQKVSMQSYQSRRTAYAQGQPYLLFDKDFCISADFVFFPEIDLVKGVWFELLGLADLAHCGGIHRCFVFLVIKDVVLIAQILTGLNCSHMVCDVFSSGGPNSFFFTSRRLQVITSRTDPCCGYQRWSIS